MLKQTGENLVLVTTSTQDPASMGEKWFIGNSILKPEEIIDGKTVTTPAYTVVFSQGFYIQILRNQFAIFLEKWDDNALIDKVVGIIKTICTTKLISPIPAIGINFLYETDEL